MADLPKRLAERLEADGEKTFAFFLELAPSQWSQPVYTTGEQWTIHQVLAHFVSAEARFSELLNDITQGGEGAPEGFDIDAFNEGEVAELQAITPGQLLDRFMLLRQQTVHLVENLEPDDLQKTGRHPFLGIVPLDEIIKLIYRHNQIHLRDLRRIIDAG